MRKHRKGLDSVGFEVHNGVATITINKPHRRNAVDSDMLEEIHLSLLEADDLKAVHCVVLQGAAGNFCSGFDLGSGSENSQDDKEYDPSLYRSHDSFDDDLWSLWRRSESRTLAMDMFKPVIAKVDGYCLGVGTDLALMCDLVLVSNEARIGFPPTRSFGSPANHMWLYHVGPQWAKYLLLTGDMISGRDAAHIGLAFKAVRADRLDSVASEIARRLTCVSPDLLATQKRIVNKGLELMGARTLQREASESDARSHLSQSFKDFFSVVRDKGFKQAIRERDAAFGDGLVSVNDVES